MRKRERQRQKRAVLFFQSMHTKEEKKTLAVVDHLHALNHSLTLHAHRQSPHTRSPFHSRTWPSRGVLPSFSIFLIISFSSFLLYFFFYRRGDHPRKIGSSICLSLLFGMTEGGGRPAGESSMVRGAGESTIPSFDSPDAAYGWMPCQVCHSPVYLRLSNLFTACFI